MDGLLRNRAPAADVARVTKEIVAETKVIFFWKYMFCFVLFLFFFFFFFFGKSLKQQQILFNQCEAGIARELAADPAYKNRSAGFNEAGDLLDKHSPTFASAAKHFCKGDPDSATRREIAELQAASSKLMNLFEGDSNASLLGAIEKRCQIDCLAC